MDFYFFKTFWRLVEINNCGRYWGTMMHKGTVPTLENVIHLQTWQSTEFNLEMCIVWHGKKMCNGHIKFGLFHVAFEVEVTWYALVVPIRPVTARHKFSVPVRKMF